MVLFLAKLLYMKYVKVRVLNQNFIKMKIHFTNMARVSHILVTNRSTSIYVVTITAIYHNAITRAVVIIFSVFLYIT